MMNFGRYQIITYFKNHNEHICWHMSIPIEYAKLFYVEAAFQDNIIDFSNVNR